MATKTITLNIRPRGKPIQTLPEVVSVESDASTSDLYSKLASQAQSSVHRLRVTKGSDGSLVSSDGKTTIYSTGLRDQSTVYVKDLGPQISWQTVFIVEYLGPLLIHPAFYFLQPYIYGKNAYPSLSQSTFFALICLHFVKRELETLFVHRFSLATMPARNIFKNCAHYWILGGLNIAPWVYRPSAPTATQSPNTVLLYSGIVIYVIGELGNLSSHLTLKGLRSAGGKERGIPQGVFFRLVTCPNYMFEILAWFGMYFVSNLSWALLVMLVVSAGQMIIWGKKKERRYRKEFGDKYKKKRSTVLPGII
ncbi:putative steroid alpha reductase family protein [Phaeomoniella chlamydospora]|uniref:very-long-chain enoyl-CoA reductase n=1 Tax=Phaeomoniella chlamydospora TaxID=158046 RepID=A0A0G2EIX6_PHACM|nr:putative steroid alpha reductase family protein [Phaeomoniella chlamydospora]